MIAGGFILHPSQPEATQTESTVDDVPRVDRFTIYDEGDEALGFLITHSGSGWLRIGHLVSATQPVCSASSPIAVGEEGRALDGPPPPHLSANHTLQSLACCTLLNDHHAY